MSLRIWTDGCCSAQAHGRDGPGGWAFVAVQPGGGVVHRAAGGVPFADSNRMELLAVLEALRWAAGRSVEVFTDSHYVAHGFNKALPFWRTNDWRYGKRKGRRPIRDADLWQTVWSVSRNAPAKVERIRRAIHVHNVDADQAAKEAMRYAIGARTRPEQLLMHAIDNALRGCS